MVRTNCEALYSFQHVRLLEYVFTLLSHIGSKISLENEETQKPTNHIFNHNKDWK